MNNANGRIKESEFEPVIVAFLCNWCSYAGADLAGTSRYQYPPNLRIIRVPCSSRVDPLFIFRALQNAADGVLISGCHIGDCHYINGNYYARRRFYLLHQLLDQTGIASDRVRFTWVSASEGGKFASLITEYTDTIRRLGPATQLVKGYIPWETLFEESKQDFSS